MRTVVTGVAVAGAVVVLMRLSAWQWERARTRDSLLSYTYAAEWMLLAVVLVVTLLVRRRRGRRPGEDDGAARDVAGRVIGPPLRPGEELGEVLGVRVRRRLSAVRRRR